MHDNEVQKLSKNKKIDKIIFNGGMSGHCNFINKIKFKDGEGSLTFKIAPLSDWSYKEIVKMIDWDALMSQLEVEVTYNKGD